MERIQYLLAQYLSNKATPAETGEMLQWLQSHPGSEDLLRDAWEANPRPAPVADLDRMWSVIAPATTPRRQRRIWPVAAAAAAALLLGITTFTYLHPKNHGRETAASMPYIAPGRNGAILILADGSRVSLDSAAAGIVAVQNGAPVTLQNHQLQYQAPGTTAGATAFNTVSTPKGRQFQVQLPDGSRAWLNAASSIRFPTTFAGPERRVSITGEVYFEIAQNASKPFLVNTPASEIAVLGTSFNVNAYTDEGQERTTLLSGKIATTPLEQPGARMVLAPGEQSQYTAGKYQKLVKHADTEQVMAWKNGAFNFQDMSLQEVMRQLGRWYDLEIVYEKGIPDIHFGGEMSRNVPLADLLSGLKEMGIHFRVEGHQLIVSP
ncbi:iron dicitrate transport regulator FecR [Chitinophaga parva]|uniref:Iron dicitrate transport regulator FecR n=1 Tax=Chitinophaga parva TaxID=2169414 RepID=A0A2T7BLX3_9BACT|nr:FecR family protein [Chitinophaga parva]PUZ28649.1 iron dicitrate transport regulator FecR [Chitinophaga parva]